MEEKYIKNFNAWNTVKQSIDQKQSRNTIRAGEIRWVSFGVNIGSEIDGKGGSFTRPALILHVIGDRLALVVPISSKVKNIFGYLPFELGGLVNSLCIHQIRCLSHKRILSRKAKLSMARLESIKRQIVLFYSF